MSVSQDIDNSTPKLRGYLDVKNFPSSGRSRARLPRKWWRRQWVVLDIVETLDTPALIGRIYNSHLHEDRTLPVTTVTLTDVHALHRIQSRSHPFAFSIDGNCQCLILSGHTETESQLWMQQTRQLLWPRNPQLQLWHRQEISSALFEVSLIDNVNSDILRMRGFYGYLVVEGRDLVLIEARSGQDQNRWSIKSLKKWFCAKVANKEDRGKILVIISHKSSSSGEGIFTFYSPRAREIVGALEATSRMAPRQPLPGLEGKKASKMNPLLAFLRRSSTPASPSLLRVQHHQDGNSQPNKSSLKANGAKPPMGKSVSVMDNLSPRHIGSSERRNREAVRSQRSAGSEEMLNSNSMSNLRRGISLERHTSGQHESRRGFHSAQRKILTNSKKKKSSSESDLLNAGFNPKQTSRSGYAISSRSGNQNDSDLPAPPRPEELLLLTASDTMHTVTGTEGQDGFYRSFDDIDDIDLGVLASSNPLEAAVVLRSQPEASAARYSFNSSDSGRMSDTYGETSNSSVASSSGHSNRICSNTSNCSGDSGAQMSDSSCKESSRPLEVLKEQASPDYPPFDQELYGETISIIESTSGSTSSGQQTQQPQQQHQQVSQQPPTDPEESTEDYYYIPLRYATVRKSFTLPHNMNGSANPVTPTMNSQAANYKTKDLAKFLGLVDDGPGSPTKEVAQAVALQSLPEHLRSPSKDAKKNVEKFLGIASDNVAQETRTLPTEQKRNRPKSLGLVNGCSLERRSSQDGSKTNPGHDSQATLNRTLARLQKFYSQDSRSVPTTPVNQQSLNLNTSPRRKNLTKFLGLVNGKQQQPLPETPSSSVDPGSCKSGGGLTKSSLSSSTPMVLESCENEDIYHSVSEARWQSNEGLLTPGSVGGGMSPFCRSPEKTSHPSGPTSLNTSKIMTADKGVMTCFEDSQQNFYGNHFINPMPCNCQQPPRGLNYGTVSATSSPFHTGPRAAGLGGSGRGRAASAGRSQVSSLQRGTGMGAVNRMRGPQPQSSRKLPRSMTLDDLDPQQFDYSYQHHYHHPVPQHQPRSHYCQPQMHSLICTPVSRVSRRESLGYDPCSPCHMNSLTRQSYMGRPECCTPDLPPGYCVSPQQVGRSSYLCNQYQEQIDCHSLSRVSRTRDSCRGCVEANYVAMTEMNTPTSKGVVVIPITPSGQTQQTSKCTSFNLSQTNYPGKSVACHTLTESDYLDMRPLRSMRSDDYQLRESSVDPESSYVDPDCGPSSTNRTSSSSSYVAATVVGVGLGGKTCIAVNEKSSVETTSVKIWTTSEDVSTSNFVQTTAIVHPTPK